MFFRTEKKWGDWIRASARDFNALLDFLSPRAHSSVPFTSRLLNTSRKPDSTMLNRNPVFIKRESGRVSGALMLSPESIFSPVFGENCDIRDLDAMAASSSFFKKKYITLMGSTEDVKRFESVIYNRSSMSVDYHLLSAASKDILSISHDYVQNKEASSMGIQIRLASTGDLNLLMPLRRAYEIEEVILSPENFNEISCRRRFSMTIKEHAVFFADSGGRPLATSCINAEGIGFMQIGGVFTLPELRSKGISATLMQRIAEHASALNKDLTLFVKKDNPAALKLYKNCGFKKRGDYRITYLESR
ncbi:MAG: GNAT family N-acetyltransferase [Spirochaetales bacterium]|uniref:GNAT family N-acetyltransferase n=1 Tax=Candidatus Thalassospirochaeta sargassi TaxID=3119039 RepID=A0AAJ1IID5_9SPIO|nr:GNAT family N-acetyltransferase [Spirochaetales bacterium]